MLAKVHPAIKSNAIHAGASGRKPRSSVSTGDNERPFYPQICEMMQKEGVSGWWECVLVIAQAFEEDWLGYQVPLSV
jgi:hypothetical protein